MKGLSVAEAIEHGVVAQFVEGKLSEAGACKRLDVHRSTLYRKAHRLEAQGPLGLVHGLRGRPSNFAWDSKLRQAICTLYEKEYKPYGFRVAHFHQEAKLPAAVSYPTVLRWLKAEKIVQKSRKGWKHHTRRPRREAFGELIQMDTSIHDWLDWGKNLALISNMDDCTNVLCGAFLTQADTTLGNMSVLKQTLTTYGLFDSLYVDRSPIFKVTRTGGIGRINQPTFQTGYITQVKRALDELGIQMIYAYSPQAKGRIERSYLTWQTRLIPELRKNGIREIDQANRYIQKVFIPKHNQRFAQDPKTVSSAFIPLTPNLPLDYILAEQFPLTVSNDHIVASKAAGISLRILPSKHRLSYAKAKVTVYRHTNGKLSVLYKDQPLNFIPYAS